VLDECHVADKWARTGTLRVNCSEHRGGSDPGSDFAFELMSAKGV